MALTEQNSKNLSGMNTFRMNVSCKKFIDYDSISDLMDLDPEELPHPIKQIGGGSNLLFTGDFKGTILHSSVDFIEELEDEEDDDNVYVSVGSGVVFDDLCAWAADNGLWGIENLSNIPGEVGAAAVQNIGAYGVEFKDVVDEVFCYDMNECEELSFTTEECGYGYRSSIFKTPEYRNLIVTHVIVRLSKNPIPSLDYGHLRAAVEQELGVEPGQAETRLAEDDNMSGEGLSSGLRELDPELIRKVIIDIRSEKLPDPKFIGSAGSFFKNPIVSREEFARIEAVAHKDNGPDCKVPHYDVKAEDGSDMVKVPAAWMIEQCGWKGRRFGNAGVYENQPLVLINATGRAEPEEIIALEGRVISSVKAKYGVTLSPEVEHV